MLAAVTDGQFIHLNEMKLVIFVTGPTKIDSVSANYTELYFC